MLIFSINGQIYVYIHIPKNSGRYIKQQIGGKFECHHLVDNIVQNQISFVNPVLTNDFRSTQFPHFSYQQIILNKNELSDITPDSKYITFTRNPYDKLISGYFYAISSRPSDVVNISVERLRTLTMEEFINSLILEFRNFIKNRLNLLVEKHLIVKPQYKYVIDENGDIPLNLKFYRLEDYTTNTEAHNFFQFENFNLRKYDYSIYYDNECITIINEIYSKDFELFGYDKITSL